MKANPGATVELLFDGDCGSHYGRSGTHRRRDRRHRIPFTGIAAEGVAFFAFFALGGTSTARAQSSSSASPPGDRQPTISLAAEPGVSDVASLEQIRRESMDTRRFLADAVLLDGLVGIAGGVALMIPDANDQAWRFAGINTAFFGLVNAVVGGIALAGIAREEQAWESDGARAARRTVDGLRSARIHAAIDERRESVAHAMNLGPNCAYLGVAGTSLLASQLGVEHPNRWLGSGVAIGLQAIVLVAIDLTGVTKSQGYHRAILGGFAPTLAVDTSSRGGQVRLGFARSF